jgi:hypothetical protein
MRLEVDRDLCVGVALVGFGGFVAAVARTYAVGTPAKMGPGFFPLMVGTLIVVLGLVLAARALAARRRGADGANGGRATLRPGPLLVLIGGLVVFALVAEVGGVALAIAALVVVSARAGGAEAWGRARALETAALAVALAAFAVGLFVHALGLPLRVWPAL